MNDVPVEYARAVRPLLFRAELVDGLRRLVDTAGDKATAGILTEAADMLSRDGLVFDHLAGVLKQVRN